MTQYTCKKNDIYYNLDWIDLLRILFFFFDKITHKKEHVDENHPWFVENWDKIHFKFGIHTQLNIETKWLKWFLQVQSVALLEPSI